MGNQTTAGLKLCRVPRLEIKGGVNGLTCWAAIPEGECTTKMVFLCELADDQVKAMTCAEAQPQAEITQNDRELAVYLHGLAHQGLSSEEYLKRVSATIAGYRELPAPAVSPTAESAAREIGNYFDQVRSWYAPDPEVIAAIIQQAINAAKPTQPAGKSAEEIAYQLCKAMEQDLPPKPFDEHPFIAETTLWVEARQRLAVCQGLVMKYLPPLLDCQAAQPQDGLQSRLVAWVKRELWYCQNPKFKSKANEGAAYMLNHMLTDFPELAASPVAQPEGGE